jgi:putative DNA primase/helicase
MNWLNYDDVVGQLKGAGLVLDGPAWPLVVNKFMRCKVDGDREKRGWYKLFELALNGGDRILVGSYGVFRGDDSGSMKIELPTIERRRLDPGEQAAIKARQVEDRKRAQAEREREVQRASARATGWWRQAVDTGESAYLTRKGLPPGRLYGARLSPAGNLVIPLQNGKSTTFGLQVIYHDPKVKERKGRDKDYAPPGLSKAGKWFQIGTPHASGGIILVCEGFATGASLHEATGLPVAVAFDAGNLLPVGEALKALYRGRAKLLFCADDDYLARHKPGCGMLTLADNPVCGHCGQEHGKENTGAKRAQAAALAVDGAWIVPIFTDQRPIERKGPTDFNDLHVAPSGGLDAVRTQVEAPITALGWKSATWAASRVTALLSTAGGAGSERLAMRSVIPLEEAADRFVLVYGGKGTLFDRTEHLLVPKADVLDILPEHGWRDLRNTKAVVRLDEVGFDPAGTDTRIKCNLWSGWPTIPKEGVCTTLLDLLEYLCSEEKNARDIFQWVLKWLAYPIQHPGAKMRTALVFHGPQGAGKNFFFESVMSIYGDYGRIVDQSAIEDKFNDWASRKLFLIADEVVARQELFHVKNKLKGLITGDWIRINPKNVAAHDERNHVNLVFLSNEHQPLVLEKGDRRYTVIWTPPTLPASFYTAVKEEIAKGGIAALHHHLATLDLGDFDEHSKPPMTQAKRDLIDVSMGSTERFHADWEAGDTHHPFCPCSSADLYSAYQRWCRVNGVSRPREQNQFLAYFAKIPGWSRTHADRHDSMRDPTKKLRQRFVIPSPDDLAKAAKRPRATDYQRPAEKTQTEWLTECYFDFKDSLRGDDPGMEREYAA